MSGQIDWLELFFSSTGRVARGPFLIAAAVLVLLAALYEAVVGPTVTVHFITGLFIYPVLLFSACCVLSKRLHDRGRSGWIAGILVVALIMVWPQPAGLLDYVACLALVWGVVELGVMGGEQGANRFGPNPSRPVQA